MNLAILLVLLLSAIMLTAHGNKPGHAKMIDLLPPEEKIMKEIIMKEKKIYDVYDVYDVYDGDDVYDMTTRSPRKRDKPFFCCFRSFPHGKSCGQTWRSKDNDSPKKS